MWNVDNRLESEQDRESVETYIWYRYRTSIPVSITWVTVPLSFGFWCRINLWFRLMGFCTASRWRHRVRFPDHRHVCARNTASYRLCVTMEKLWQQQYGGYVFYISKSTVVDWTCWFFIMYQYLQDLSEPHTLRKYTYKQWLYIYIGFKTFFYVFRHIESISSYLPTGFHLGFLRSWPSL